MAYPRSVGYPASSDERIVQVSGYMQQVHLSHFNTARLATLQ